MNNEEEVRAERRKIDGDRRKGNEREKDKRKGGQRRKKQMKERKEGQGRGKCRWRRGRRKTGAGL